MTITKPTVKAVVVKKKYDRPMPKQPETPWKVMENSLGKITSNCELNQINPNPVDPSLIDKIADML